MVEQAVWPSVEEQLSEAKVVAGSALERLIRENQDFRMLGPEEVSDGLELPLWLRVYWRKAHPGGRGYPRPLKGIHLWMLTHQDLR